MPFLRRCCGAACTGILILALLNQTVNCSESEEPITRVKRQSSFANAGSFGSGSNNLQDGNNFIDSIFQIPISTLNAVGSLIKNTRPIVMRARERIEQQYNQYQQQQQQYSRPRPSRGSSNYNSNNNRNKRRRYGIQGRDYSNY